MKFRTFIFSIFIFVVTVGTPFEANASSPAMCYNKTIKITNRLVTFGYKKSTNARKVDTIILHSSHSLGKDPYSVTGTIALYKQYKVSPHYLISRDGTIYKLVDEKNVAYHAGVSTMPDGRKNTNDFSIGVEIIGLKTDTPTDAQYKSLSTLVANIKTRHAITSVTGHSNIAPTRKSDPWNFDWQKWQAVQECK
jgi:N-acetyl-anhydromuramyl-L-alanine amidase AmpD